MTERSVHELKRMEAYIHLLGQQMHELKREVASLRQQLSDRELALQQALEERDRARHEASAVALAGTFPQQMLEGESGRAYLAHIIQEVEYCIAQLEAE